MNAWNIAGNRGWRLCLVATTGLMVRASANAWDPDTATTAELCQWSPVVRVGGHCTGAYVGNRVILTAAHCLFGATLDTPPVVERLSLSQMDIGFGETGFGSGTPAEFTIDVVACVEHPEADPGINPFGDYTLTGVDLAYCILEENPPVPVPTVPPMVPDGCARDWLSHALFGVAPERPLAIGTGMGCDQPPEDPNDTCDPSGFKRFTGVEIDDFTAGKEFVITRHEQDVGLQSGDSGGPLFARLPDHTWRLIGVNHSTSAQTTQAIVQSVPPYLAWVEWRSGIDITPCHTRTPGTTDYVFTGGCAGTLPLDPGVEQGDWTTGCEVTLGGPSDGASDECAEWPIGGVAVLVAPTI